MALPLDPCFAITDIAWVPARLALNSSSPAWSLSAAAAILSLQEAGVTGQAGSQLVDLGY